MIWSLQINVLNNCKQNTTSLSLFVGTTVYAWINIFLHRSILQTPNCHFNPDRGANCLIWWLIATVRRGSVLYCSPKIPNNFFADIFKFYSCIKKPNTGWYFMRIVYWQTIQMSISENDREIPHSHVVDKPVWKRHRTLSHKTSGRQLK